MHFIPKPFACRQCELQFQVVNANIIIFVHNNRPDIRSSNSLLHKLPYLLRIYFNEYSVKYLLQNYNQSIH